MLELVGRSTQHLTKIDQKTRKIRQIYIWNPMTTGFIMYTLICIISVEFLSLESQSEEKWMFSLASYLTAFKSTFLLFEMFKIMLGRSIYL